MSTLSTTTIAAAAVPELALALTQAESLSLLFDLGPRPVLAGCLQRLDSPLDQFNGDTLNQRIERLHLGNEFCERLLPTAKELTHVKTQAQQLELKLCLVTPMLTDAGFKRLETLLPLLDQGTEVVVNDWGTLQRLRSDHSDLVPVLGRMLNKMIKDPRLPSEQWTQLHPHNSQSQHLRNLLERFDISHLEMDVPPFARTEHFYTAPLSVSVHLPYGYTVKGRMCRIGSVGQDDQDKFIAAHACHKECLNFWAKTERGSMKSEHELVSFQRGNTQFYRHSQSMSSAIEQAIERQWINRLVVAGDWHENYRATESA